MKRADRAMLMMLDVGGLKKVSDLYGYKVGDKLLIDVSNALRKIVGEKDTLVDLVVLSFTLRYLKGSF